LGKVPRAWGVVGGSSAGADHSKVGYLARGDTEKHQN